MSEVFRAALGGLLVGEDPSSWPLGCEVSPTGHTTNSPAGWGNTATVADSPPADRRGQVFAPTAG